MDAFPQAEPKSGMNTLLTATADLAEADLGEAMLYAQTKALETQHPPQPRLPRPRRDPECRLHSARRVLACLRVAQSPSVSAASLSARKVEIARLAALAAADAQANERLAGRPRPLTLTSASSDPWVMPSRMQAFDMPAKAQRAFRQAVDDAARKLDGAMKASSCVTVHGEETYFVSTAGAYQHTLGTSVA